MLMLLSMLLDGRHTLNLAGQFLLILYPNFLKAFLATVTGRYFAMDRDHRWDRTQSAFDAMTFGQAETSAHDVTAALDQAYQNGISDEFIPATVIGSYQGMADGDGLIMGNFRADRARQILSAYLLDDAGFDTSSRPAFSASLGLFLIQTS